MYGKLNAEGERVVIGQVVDYFVTDDPTYSRDRLTSARVLEWTGKEDLAAVEFEKCMNGARFNWEAIRDLALLEQRKGNCTHALELAHVLTRHAPWRAESYDTLSYVADKCGDIKISEGAKEKGDKVFSEETVCFERLRDNLDEYLRSA
jgi:hypothetical protein